MWRGIHILMIASALFILQAGCVRSTTYSPLSSPRRNITEVLATHEKDLMQIPGVVGVFVGLAEDGKTVCIKVMLKAADPATEKKIPRQIEGYQVITEITGEIRPLQR
jgi:hypothetical protein